MTKQIEILNDPKFVPVHDHGFVGLIDVMGSDNAIVQAARVSYGAGTKTVNEDRGLIRYLLRHKHTSPIEMCEVKLYLKMPIFIMRQWVRHRTASLNEYSGRYSVMSDEMYIPDADYLQPQSKTNKQGRDGDLTAKEKEGIQFLFEANNKHAYDTYDVLRRTGEEWEGGERHALYDMYAPEPTEEFHSEGYFDGDYPGLARELARISLPLSTYTEVYWKQDMHNLLHLIKLRRDSHAQREIRDYAEAVYTLIKPHFPHLVEAWEDYVWGAETLSRMEVELVRDLLAEPNPTAIVLEDWITAAGGEKEFALSRGLSLREFREFRVKWHV